jgi:hypothetical protein
MELNPINIFYQVHIYINIMRLKVNNETDGRTEKHGKKSSIA